jgi:hypothetical protein
MSFRSLAKFAVIALTIVIEVGALASAADPYESDGLVQEVITEISNPVVFDFRRADWEFTLIGGYNDEANNFKNEVWGLTVGMPMQSGSVFRFGLNRVNVMTTPSSHKIGRSPFTQDATMSRYEMGLSFAFNLMEGKSVTRLSTIVPDFEHIMYVTFGGSFNHPNEGLMPKKRDYPEPLPGQRRVHSKYSYAVGLEWQIFMPQAVGLRIGADLRFLPAFDSDLLYYPFYFVGMVWAPDW